MTLKDFLEQHRNVGKVSLRRRQWMSAMGEKSLVTRTVTKNGETNTTETEEYILLPSVPMQIWLGKNMLGQKDKVEASGHVELRKFVLSRPKNR